MTLNNANKKKAVIYGTLALVVLMFAFYFLTIFQNLNGELKSAKSEVEMKRSELASLQSEAQLAHERESEYNSLCSDMAVKSKSLYGEDEEQDRIYYELGEIFTEAQINLQNTSFNKSDFTITPVQAGSVMALTAGESVESSSETETTSTNEEDTIKGEKMVTMNTETQTTVIEMQDIRGSIYEVNLTFRTGYEEFRNLLSIFESRPKRIVVKSVSFTPLFAVPPAGKDYIEYEIDEAGIPNDYAKVLERIEKEEEGDEAVKEDFEQIKVYEFNVTISYYLPEFVARYRELESFEIPEDLKHELKKDAETEEGEVITPFDPPEWYLEQNDENLEKNKKENK